MRSRLGDMKNKVDPRTRNQPSYHNAGSNLHPKPERSGIRGKVSGVIHRNDSSSGLPQHEARPIETLTDPSSFAPPPKRTATGLAPAPPPSNVKRNVVQAPSKYQDPRAPAITPPVKNSHAQSYLDYQAENGQAQQLQIEDAPRGPYRTDTTGLATNHLPPPPGRRDGADGRSAPSAPPSYATATNRPALPAPASRAVPAPPPRSGAGTPSSTASGAKPSLPPRLPPRTNSTPVSNSSAASSSNNLLNQGAVNRLGQAGVQVAGLGIGEQQTSASPSPPPPPRQPQPQQSQPQLLPEARPQPSAQVSELQNRFANLRATGANTSPAPPTQQPAPARGQGQPGGGMNSAAAAAAAKKKPPPPPPPKKKPGLGGSALAPAAPAEDAPPPIPMSTRPTF